MRFALGHHHRRFGYVEPLQKPSQPGILTAARTIVAITNGCLTTWQYSQDGETAATSIRFRDGVPTTGFMIGTRDWFGIEPHFLKIGFVSHFSQFRNALEHCGTPGNTWGHLPLNFRSNPGTCEDTRGHLGTIRRTKPPIAKHRTDQHLRTLARYAGRGVGEDSSTNAHRVPKKETSPQSSPGLPGEEAAAGICQLLPGEAFIAIASGNWFAEANPTGERLGTPRRNPVLNYTKLSPNIEAKTAFVALCAGVAG